MNKELRNDLIAGVVMAILLTPGYFVWAHSPTVTAEKEYQRQHAIEFLIQHRWGMLPEDVAKVMEVYSIREDDIKPFQFKEVRK